MTLTEMLYHGIDRVGSRVADMMSMPHSTLSSALKPYDRRLNLDQDRLLDLIDAADRASLEKFGRTSMDAVRLYMIQRLSNTNFEPDGDLMPELRMMMSNVGRLAQIQNDHGGNPDKYPAHVKSRYLKILAELNRGLASSVADIQDN